MKKLLIILTLTILFISCKNNMEKSETKVNQINQDINGSISLNLDNTNTLYNDIKNPQNNTAEWNIQINKSGRFNVWISTATIDTINLKYNTVILNIHNRLHSMKSFNIIL